MADTTVKNPKPDSSSDKNGVKKRKKPVRKAPVQKDYPNKLAWLKAMTEFEEAESAKVNEAKVTRIDKRIKSAQAQVDELTAKVEALKAERAKLVPADETDEYGWTAEDHLAAEGKA